MMRPLFDIDTLKDQIEKGALILTPNNRLANKIRQAWGLRQQQSGHHSWPAPRVEAIESWLDEQWLRCVDLGVMAAGAGTPVNPQMELILWEQAIDQDSEKPDVLLPGTLTRQARSAYDIVQRWQVSDVILQQETPMFWRWVEHFRRALTTHRLITTADKAYVVRQTYKDGLLPSPHSIHLCGFDYLSPLYEDVLTNAATQITRDEIKRRPAPAVKLACFSESQELSAAVNWAVARQQSDPEARIGIIIPELSRLRGQTERLLYARLNPGYNLPQQSRQAPPFNISAGISLSSCPLVSNALLLLELNRRHLPLETLCQILNSPFWGESTPRVRAETETQLREKAQMRLRCSELRFQLSRNDLSEEGGLARRLETMESLRREMPDKAGYGQWLELFQQQLTALGWPGERSLDSIEYQQLQHWQNLLQQYPQLDQLGMMVELPEALRQLQHMATSAVFQPETPDSPIQVLGLLESAGLHFDHLWVMGLDDRQWPQSISPNPLLPFTLQRQLNMPRSNPGRELSLAKKLLSNLLQAAPEVVLSYSQFDGEQLLQPSELISDIPPITFTALPMNTAGEPAKKSGSVTLETLSCEYAPPLDIARESIRGGTGIFKQQASCPFNAFAIHRLGARQPPPPSPGLSAMERGNLVHECLERLWARLENQAQLMAMDEQALNQLVDEITLSAVREFQKNQRDLFGPVFTTLEQQRLSKLLLSWLAMEKTRQPFAVAGMEKRLDTEFAGLPLRMTIDRIDTLDSGERIIIDYKTGSASTRRWLGERPEEPQLPLYLLCSEDPVAAVCFAQINSSEQKFMGYANSEGLLPGVMPPRGKNSEPDNWDHLLEQWQQSLNQLGEEFKQGYAAVEFHHPQSRQFSAALEPLNRAAEMTTSGDGENDE